MTETNTRPEFFDNASNHGNPAVASAIARARRSAIEDGTAWTVTWDGAYWNGSRYDVLSLAKDLAFNGADVTVETDRGLHLGRRAIRAATY